MTARSAQKPNAFSAANGKHITYSKIDRELQGGLGEQRIVRLWRTFISFMIFACTSLWKLHQEEFIINSFLSFVDTSGLEDDSNNNTNSTSPIAPLPDREWDRMLFGIFTYDSPNEAEVRAASRETHLSYYRYSHERAERWDTVCSLAELMGNAKLARDPNSCRVVYAFVMGGGASSDENMRKKVSYLKDGRNSVSEVKTRCLWEDPECGGKDITKWTLDRPNCTVSETFARELEVNDDITLLSVPENHELGKTDTWFTYAAMLTRSRPELQIGFVGKLDSDNFVRWPVFFQFLQTHREEMKDTPFVYGGYTIHRTVCSGKVYAEVCKNPKVIFDWFASGAMAYLSTPLAQHVFMDGTNLTRKEEVWVVGEDMQLGNMVYSDARIQPLIINHRYGALGKYINKHCFNNATRYRREYFSIYKDQREAMEAERNATSAAG